MEKTKTKEMGDKINETNESGTLKELITCPHCKGLILHWSKHKSDEMPIYQGDCVDCVHLEYVPTEPDVYDKNTKGHLFVKIPGKKYVAMCGFPHNESIFFTEEDLAKRYNSNAYYFTGQFKGQNSCIAFYPKDKK